MSVNELEEYLGANKVECNLSIKQPWILWRKETSLISLDEIAEKIKNLE